MWIWLVIVIVCCDLLLRPENIRWWLFVGCVLQLSVIPARIVRCSLRFTPYMTHFYHKTPREGLLLILRLAASSLIVTAVLAFVDFRTEWLHVLIRGGLTLLYGIFLYHNHAEYTGRWASPRFRRFWLWDMVHDYYGLDVWYRQVRHSSGQGEADGDPTIYQLSRLRRLWAVSTTPHQFYRRQPPHNSMTSSSSSSSHHPPPTIWLSYPYGSHSVGTILAFGLYGTTQQSTVAAQTLVMLDESHFRVPLLRELLLLGGCIAYSEQGLEDLLEAGHPLVLSLGLYQSTLESEESRIAHVLTVADRGHHEIVPIAVLGEHTYLPGIQHALLRHVSVHLPTICVSSWEPSRCVIIGTPLVLRQSVTPYHFYRQWLDLFDESRCALRRCERYYLPELTMEQTTLEALRQHTGQPLVDRKKLFIT